MTCLAAARLPCWSLALSVLVAPVLGCEGAGNGGTVGALVPAVTTSTNSLNFGAVYVGATRILTVEVTSTGTAPTNLGDASVDGRAFSLLSGNSGLLRPQDVETFSVLFAPSANREESGTLRIPHDAGGDAVFEIELRAEGREAPDCDDGNPCTNNVFDLEEERCITINLDTLCDDGNACTEQDRCALGACVGSAVTCAEDDNPCTIGLCDPDLGCRLTAVDSLCDDADPCTEDFCDVAEGCQFEAKPDYSLCGVFEQCADTNLCFAGVCTPVPTEDGTPCHDDNACTVDDVCTDGVCGGTRIQRQPEIVSESFFLRGDFDEDDAVQSHVSDLEVAPGVFVVSHPETQVIAFSPHPQQPDEDTAIILATLGWIRDVTMVKRFDNGLHVLFDEGSQTATIIDFSDPATPLFVDHVAAVGSRIATEDNKLAVCQVSESGLWRSAIFEVSPEAGATPLPLEQPIGPDHSCWSEMGIGDATYAERTNEDEVTFYAVAGVDQGQRLGTLLLPSAPEGTNEWYAGPVASGDYFYLLRFTETADDEISLVFLWGILPLAPFSDSEGGGPVLNTLLLSDDSPSDLYLLDANVDGAFLRIDDEVWHVTRSGAQSFLEASDASLTFSESDDEVRVRRVVSGVERGTGQAALSSTLTRLRSAEPNLWAFGQSSLVQTTEDDAIAGAEATLQQNVRVFDFNDAALFYPGGAVWSSEETFTASDVDPRQFEFFRQTFSEDGAMTTSPSGLIDLPVLFGLDPQDVFSASVLLDLDGCVGAIYASLRTTANGDRSFLGIVSVCGPNPLTLFGQVEIEPVDPVTQRALELKIADGTHVLLSTLRSTRVVDFTAPLGAAIVADVPHDEVGLVSAAYHDDHLVFIRNPRFSNAITDAVEIQHLNLADGSSQQGLFAEPLGPHLASPYAEQPLRFRRVLRVAFPRAFVATSGFLNGHPQDAIDIFNLSGPEVTLDARLWLSGPATDAELIGDKLFVLENAGLATISPPCGPND